MIRFIAKHWAKLAYQFRQHVESETNLLHAGLATRLAGEKKDLAAKLTKEADDMDARIKEVTEMEEKGFWLCEDGHEKGGAFAPDEGGESRKCIECGKPAKLIKRDQMSGQEKYESDKERTEAEGIAKSKRDQAKAEEENVANSEKTAKYFRDLAANNRSVAEKIRRL